MQRHPYDPLRAERARRVQYRNSRSMHNIQEPQVERETRDFDIQDVCAALGVSVAKQNPASQLFVGGRMGFKWGSSSW